MDILTNISLFSGAGGLDLGAKLVGGFRTVAYCEWEPYAQGVLMSRMRDGGLDEAPLWDDVSTFDGKPWRGSVDVVSGGFPCQDVSVAAGGRQLGITDGKRTGLWKEYFRLVCEIRPRFVYMENVAGLLMGGGIGIVLGDLASIGFDAEWSCVSASQVGAPHKRERVWIVAYPYGLRRPCLEKNKEIVNPRVHPENSATWGNVPFDISLPMAEVDAEALPGILRMDDGLAEAMDGIRLCGNGVVPKASAAGWRKIKDLAGL